MSLNAFLRLVRGAAERRFDRKHGLDTCGIVEKPQFIGVPEDVGRDATYYAPSSRVRLRRLIRHSRIDPSEFHFVDLGTGKGRPLILASAYPFRSIVGVEADHELCEIARANVRAWSRTHASPPIDVIEGDARIAPLPEGNVFIFMFNPFTGEVFKAVAERLAELGKSSDRKVVIAYSGDVFAGVLKDTKAFRRERVRPLRRWMPSTVSLFFNLGAGPKTT